MNVLVRTLSVIVLLAASVMTAAAVDPRVEFDAQISRVMLKLNRQAGNDEEGRLLLQDLVRREYGTQESEIKWALAHSMKWGEIAAFCYIQATTGRSFQEMIQEQAGLDFWSYAEKAGMSSEKMARSLDKFARNAERERNSRIFSRLRASRRVPAMPDLGSGFGLFQEALDFRSIDTPQLTKIHADGGIRAKEEQ